MSSPDYRVRRATLDDLRQLAGLWASMNFAVEDLARRITEFQVAESAQGVLLGAVGLAVAQQQGLVHSEGFTDFSLADLLRPMLWDRIQAVALNQGLMRLWTQEQAPFWNHCGLARAEAEALQKLPAGWRAGAASPSWLTLKLRDDLDTVISADKEFAVFIESERQRTALTIRKANYLKTLALVLAFAVMALCLGTVLYLLWRNRQAVR